MSKRKCPKAITLHLSLDATCSTSPPRTTQDFLPSLCCIRTFLCPFWGTFLVGIHLCFYFTHLIIPHLLSPFQVHPHCSPCYKKIPRKAVRIASLPILLRMLCNQVFAPNLLELLKSSSSKTTQSHGHSLTFTLQGLSEAFETILFLETAPLGKQLFSLKQWLSGCHPHLVLLLFFLLFLLFCFVCSFLFLCPFNVVLPQCSVPESHFFSIYPHSMACFIQSHGLLC